MTNRSLFLAFLFLMLFNLGELSAHIMFQRHDIANIPSSNTTIRFHPADLNNDGAMDFVASTSWAPHGYENDLIEACEISITCNDPFNWPITQNGGTSIIEGSDVVKDYLTDDCSGNIGNNNDNLDFTINGQQFLDYFCDDIGPQILTIEATDDNGNTTSCTIPINVVDWMAPTITCPPDQSATLDGNCEFEIPDYTGLATASDNCSYEITQSPVSGSLVGSGNHTITLTATDPGGNTTPCSFDLTVSDNDLMEPCEISSLTCYPSFNSTILPNGAYPIVHASDFLSNDYEDCDNDLTFTANGQSYVYLNCSMVGSQILTITATDGCGNTASCTVPVTVRDLTPPSITCPENQTGFLNDDCQFEIPDYTGLATASDNCSYEITQSPVSGSLVGSGNHTITLTATDPGGNTTPCSFDLTLSDNTKPTPVCLNPTVTLNGEASFDLNLSEVYDADASSDNCTPVQVQSFSPMSVSCDQLGSIVPVTVNVSDENGNATSCTANVSVEGLPCGWSQNPDGVGCLGGSDATYNPTNGSFTVSSDGCYDPNYYSNSDSQGFASTELCGDGEIIAHVTQVVGSGWAGVSMRDDLSPSSRMLQLSVDGVALTKREMRVSPGAIAYNHLFQTQGKTWLRLTRLGNTFGAYHSLDGISWSPVIITNIPMNSCIQVGLFTENGTPAGTATATFEDVEIKPNIQPLSAPHTGGIIQAEPQEEPSVNLYPNPARNMITVDFNQEMQQPTLLRLRNSAGQVVEQRMLEPYSRTTAWNISQLPEGLYLVEIQTEGKKTKVERFVKN